MRNSLFDWSELSAFYTEYSTIVYRAHPPVQTLTLTPSETKLSAFKVALILKPSDFSWFVNSHKRLLVKLILIWWGDPSKQEQEQELYNELNNSHLFTEVQTSQIMRIVDDLVDAKLISIRVEKLRILKTIVKLAGKQKEEVKRTMVKYEKGMEKMKKAEEQVAGMQGELLRLQPQLVRTSIETSMLMSTIEKETIEVENAREVVAANEYKANEAATKAQALKAESEAELASAIPALESAVEALETMTQSDVSSLKTMRFPPYAVRLCMEAVCILLGVKPAKSTNEIGEVVNDYWVSGQKLLSDIHFLAKIRAFERDSMSKKTMKLIRDKYLSKEEFSPENVKQCSLAAEGLCRWVLAIDMYNQISKVVEPKRERLRKAEMLVKQHLKQLEVKRKALLKVTDKLQGLSDQFSQMCQKKQELESQIVSCEVRMERAERLVQALSGEKDQWKNKIAEIMREDSFNVPYSVGFTLALHVFGKLPLDERQKNLRKTMISLFPKIEVTIPCDLKSLVMLIEDSICFVNDDGRALEFLTTQFEKVIVTSQWTETERQMCLTPKSVLLFEISAENEDVAKDIEQADYFNFGEEDLIIMKIRSTQYEVNRHFRVFFRTPQRGTVLKRSIIIDNTFSDMDLKKGICEKMGLSNWGQTLNHYNAMVASRTENVRKVEKTENEMLELLGRSKDLDDERAIELLAEARNLQALVAAQSKDISEIEQSLRAVEHKMSPVIEYSLKVVKLCASLYLLDRFYKVSIMPLVDILETKLVENISSINFEQVSLAISELYWEFLHHSLSWEHKLIVNHLLFNNLNAKVEKLETTTQNQRIFDGFHNFSTFILNCKPRQLILLKYDAEVYATILQFGQVTKNANWRVFSIMEHVIARLEKLADEPIWLLLNVNRSDQKTLSQMKTILEKLKLLPVVHLSFRIILAYSDEVDCSDELIALTPTRFYFSASASLVQQTRRILANLSIRPFLDKSQETQKVQIIRMLAFHYGLTLRRKFDPEFDVLVDDADLFAMLKLYQELKNLSDEPNEQEEMLKVKLNVIEPIYYSKTKNAVELGVISGMVQWIVEGNLSIPADTLLRAVIKEKQTNYEDFAHFMQSHDDSILCGSNSRISRQCRAAQKQESIRNMKRLMELPNDTPLPSAILGKITSEPKNTVIDVESVEREVDGREMQNLTKIVAALKMKFCLKYKIGIADVEITGEVVDDNYNVNKKEFEEIPILKITNCCLISAQLSQGELKEPHNRQYDHICVLLKPMKLSTLNPRSLLLICPTSQKSVAAIPVHSQFPIAHWQLRGAFVTTGRIIQQKF
uniref:MT domain-containing protein n=1 Tax=Caenorhabditis japonica TaxID=281687 RepID=A0A8R1HK89_CAEJA